MPSDSLYSSCQDRLFFFCVRDPVFPTYVHDCAGTADVYLSVVIRTSIPRSYAAAWKSGQKPRVLCPSFQTRFHSLLKEIPTLTSQFDFSLNMLPAKVRKLPGQVKMWTFCNLVLSMFNEGVRLLTSDS